MSRKIRIFKKMVPSYSINRGCNYTPYKAKLALLEDMHIYRKNDDDYNTAIETAVNSCLNDLRLYYIDKESTSNMPQLYNIRINEPIQYAKYSMYNIIPGIDSVDLYIGYIPGPDSDTRSASNITSIDEEKIEGLTHITNQTSNNHINKAAVVIEISSLNLIYLDSWIGAVAHELKHLLHKVNSEKMAENAGWAFTYACQLCDYYGIYGIPNYENLIDILKWQDKTKKGIIAVMGMAMYVLDNDELQCWRESFNSSNKHHLRRTTDPENLYKIIPTYKTYVLLYKAIKFYFKELCEISRFLDDEGNKIVCNYFKQCHNIKLTPGYDLRTFIKHKWIPAIENQLKTLRKIHHDNLQKHNKLQKEIRKNKED